MPDTKTFDLEEFRSPKEVSDVEIAFGPARLSEYLPGPMDALPEPYCDRSAVMNNHLGSDSGALIDRWFYSGLSLKQVETTEGVESEKALTHIAACLGSYEPSHEHKCASAALLADLWFDAIETEERIYQMKAGDIE